MKTTLSWIQPAAALLFALVLSQSPAYAQSATWAELLDDNLKSLLSGDDEGGVGAGKKESAFRQKLGPAILRADFKIVPSWKGDARGKGDDELAFDLSEEGQKKDTKDAQDAWKPAIDVIAGGALDLEFGRTFEALSVEYKKNLLDGDLPEPQKPAGKKSSLLVDLLSNEDLTVKVADFTVRCPGNDDPATSAAKKALQNGTLLKDGIKLQFFAGPVPIIVRGNAGLSVSLSLGPTIDLEHSAFGGEFEPNIYAHGWLSAGIGGAIGPVSVSAGVVGKLRFIDTTVQLEGGVCLQPTAVAYVSLNAVCRAIQFEAQLFAQVRALWLSRQFTWTVFRYRAGEFNFRQGLTPRDAAWWTTPAMPALTTTPAPAPARPVEPPSRTREPNAERDPS